MIGESGSASHERLLDVLLGVGGQVIPVAGGALAGFANGERQRRVEADIRARFKELETKVSEHAEAVERLFSDMSGRAAYYRVARDYVSTGDTRKRQLLADALLYGYAAESPVERRDRLLEIARQVHPEQMPVLRHIAGPAIGSAYLESELRSFPNDQEEAEISALIGMGLVREQRDYEEQPRRHGNRGVDIRERMRYSLTSLGREFLSFLDPPRAD